MCALRSLRKTPPGPPTDMYTRPRGNQLPLCLLRAFRSGCLPGVRKVGVRKSNYLSFGCEDQKAHSCRRRLNKPKTALATNACHIGQDIRYSDLPQRMCPCSASATLPCEARSKRFVGAFYRETEREATVFGGPKRRRTHKFPEVSHNQNPVLKWPTQNHVQN